jgi:hypothetical protein
MMYGVEAWDGCRKKRNRLLATETDYLRRRSGRARSDRIRNESIREMVDDERGHYRQCAETTWFVRKRDGRRDNRKEAT